MVLNTLFRFGTLLESLDLTNTWFFFFLRDFIFKKTLFEKLEIYQQLMNQINNSKEFNKRDTRNS